MRKFAPGLALIAACLLAGCWQSDGSLFGDAKPATPFRAGAVSEVDSNKKVFHYALTLSPAGVYRLVDTDKGEMFGDGYELRFFPLRGLPRYLFAYEATSIEHCFAIAGCDPIKPDAPRYYGLTIAKMHGAEEIRPDCKADAALTRRFGIKASDAGICDFSDRATLEKALRALAASGKKPEYSYSIGE